jgi:hypothetical protein
VQNCTVVSANMPNLGAEPAGSSGSDSYKGPYKLIYHM